MLTCEKRSRKIMLNCETRVHIVGVGRQSMCRSKIGWPIMLKCEDRSKMQECE